MSLVPMSTALAQSCDPEDTSCGEPDDGGIIGGFVQNAVEGLAEAFREGSELVIETVSAFWINVDAIDLDSSPVEELKKLTMPIVYAVAVLSIIAGGIRMTIRKNKEPAYDIGIGIFRLLLVNSLFILAPNTMLKGVDELAKWVLDNAVEGDVVARFTQLAALGGIDNAAAIIIVAIFMMVVGAIQAVLMFLREGGIVILSAMLVLAASGGINPATKSWFPRVTGWLIALITYKLVAAFCFAAAFILIGEGEGLRQVLVGFAMLGLTVVALPAMMKFFSWAVPAGMNSGGGGGGMAALAGAGVAAIAMRSGGSSGFGSGGAAAQAARIERDLGPMSTGATGAVPSSAMPMASSPAAAGGGAAAAGAAAAGAAAAGPAAATVVMAGQAVAQGAKAATDKAANGVTGGVE